MTDHWDFKEVLIKQRCNFARELSVITSTLRWACSEGKVSQPGLAKQENRANDIAVEEHLLDTLLWSDWIDNPTNRVMVDEHEGRIAEYLGQM